LIHFFRITDQNQGVSQLDYAAEQAIIKLADPLIGGVRITETGGDLAVILAILSSLRNQPLPTDLVVFGEIGLTGELRPVQNGQERLKEAQKHGFNRAIVPKANLPIQTIKGIKVEGVSTLDAALQII